MCFIGDDDVVTDCVLFAIDVTFPLDDVTSSDDVTGVVSDVLGDVTAELEADDCGEDEEMEPPLKSSGCLSGLVGIRCFIHCRLMAACEEGSIAELFVVLLPRLRRGTCGDADTLAAPPAPPSRDVSRLLKSSLFRESKVPVCTRPPSPPSSGVGSLALRGDADMSPPPIPLPLMALSILDRGRVNG